MREKIGYFSANVINTLQLEITPGTPIYIADSNIQHMKTSHPSDYEKYGSDIETILTYPDYIGKNNKDDSIEFTKEYRINDEYVKVAVRVSAGNVYYVRSLYVLNNNRVRNFIRNGTLKPLDKHPK